MVSNRVDEKRAPCCVNFSRGHSSMVLAAESLDIKNRVHLPSLPVTLWCRMLESNQLRAIIDRGLDLRANPALVRRSGPGERKVSAVLRELFTRAQQPCFGCGALR